MNLDSSYKYCLDMARNHYENFPVASFIIPARYRPHIAAIYAFARTADDFADESVDLNKLMDWREQLFLCTKGKYEGPVFHALAHTIEKFELPVDWLDDLLTAFRWDIEKTRFRSMDELFEYCRHSANPVGRIVLWIFGFRSERAMKFSDHITTALQLTNFWQDLSVDLKKNRLYIPMEFLKQYRVTESELKNHQYTAKLGLLFRDLIGKTYSLYQKGNGLFSIVGGRLRWELLFTTYGGQAILQKVNLSQQNILSERPRLTKTDWSKIFLKTLVAA